MTKRGPRVKEGKGSSVNCCAGAKVREPVVGVVPVDVEGAVAGIPVHRGDKAARATRARAKCYVLDIEMLPCRQEVSELEKQSFQQCDSGNLLLGKIIRRFIGQFRIRLDSLFEAGAVRTIFRVAIVGWNISIEIGNIRLNLNSKFAKRGDHPVGNNTLNNVYIPADWIFNDSWNILPSLIFRLHS